MLTNPIAVRIPSYDIREAQAHVDTAVTAFTQYLELLPRYKTTRSKYGLLGPAGKAISELKAGRYDRDSLLGYTIRAQESAAGQGASGLHPETVEQLELAVDSILAALTAAPQPYHTAILDRLDYGLYYRLRRAELERKESVRRAWTDFLVTEYQTPERISEAWGRPVQDMRQLPLPTKRQLRRGARRSQREQSDIESFYEAQKLPAVGEDEEEWTL